MKTFVGILTLAFAAFVQADEKPCFEVGVRYPGNDIFRNGMNAESPDDCQKACAEEPECKIWTYIEHYGKCYLKTKGTEKVVPISGPKECPAPADEDSNFIMIVGEDGRRNIEVIDLNDADFSCKNFPESEMYMGFSGSVGNIPIVCAGHVTTDYCSKLDLDTMTWKRAGDFQVTHRYGGGSGMITINGNLVVTGGYDPFYDLMDSIEFISLDSSSIQNFKLPKALVGHCNIQIDDSNYMITGGGTTRNRKVETYMQNLITGTYTKGPNMKEARIGHSCTKFQLNGINYALVLGGDLGKTTVEYLNLDEKDSKWNYADIPNDFTIGSDMLTYHNNVYLFGNDIKEIRKLVCKDDIDSCRFVHQGNYQIDKYRFGNVFPVSEEVVRTFCK